MSKRYAVILPDGTESILEINGRDTLTPLQKAVGGYIEVVHVLHEGQIRTAYINEEGKRLKLQCNPKATELWWAFHQVPIAHRASADVIVGPLVIALQAEE